tara:strand:- start:2388 stop:3089 length:702 start_codon:yes stop_codon:yes gene_type:complete
MNKKSLKKNIIEKFDLSLTDKGWFLTIGDEIYLTKNNNKVYVPNENLIEILKLEFKNYNILQYSKFSLTKILISFADKLPHEKSIFVDELIKYLETDLLFYRVSSPSNLSVAQNEKWDKVIHIFDSIFQTSWNVSTNIMPLKQDSESIQKIKDYLISLDMLNLHILTYLLKITGSCIVTLLCNIKKLDATEAWETVNLEELWYNKIYNDNKKKEELASQMAEVDFYIKLLDSI